MVSCRPRPDRTLEPRPRRALPDVHRGPPEGRHALQPTFRIRPRPLGTAKVRQWRHRAYPSAHPTGRQRDRPGARGCKCQSRRCTKRTFPRGTGRPRQAAGAHLGGRCGVASRRRYRARSTTIIVGRPCRHNQPILTLLLKRSTSRRDEREAAHALPRGTVAVPTRTPRPVATRRAGGLAARGPAGTRRCTLPTSVPADGRRGVLALRVIVGVVIEEFGIDAVRLAKERDEDLYWPALYTSAGPRNLGLEGARTAAGIAPRFQG